ncbi:MAG: hypothetical protein ACYS0K_25060 [Planctomycetota bacterium]|jgi:hypothetical protein
MDPGVGRVVAQRQAIRREGGIVVALPLQRQGFVQVVEPLGLEGRVAAPEEAFPETHSSVKIMPVGGAA